MSHLHIPDGVLPAWLWLGGWLVTMAAVGVAGRLAQDADVRRRVPLLAVVSALMLVAMSSEIVPIAYHVNLTVIGGVLLGGPLSIISAFIVVVMLALLGHGGVTVIGLNAMVISSEMLIGAALFGLFVRTLSRKRLRIAAFVATILTLALTTGLVIGIVAAGGGGATLRESGALDPSTLRFDSPFAEGTFRVGLFAGSEDESGAEAVEPAESAKDEGGLSVRRFATVVLLLGPPGWVLEALVTAAVLGYVARVRPGLIWGARSERSALRPPGDEGAAR